MQRCCACGALKKLLVAHQGTVPLPSVLVVKNSFAHSRPTPLKLCPQRSNPVHPVRFVDPAVYRLHVGKLLPRKRSCPATLRRTCTGPFGDTKALFVVVFPQMALEVKQRTSVRFAAERRLRQGHLGNLPEEVTDTILCPIRVVLLFFAPITVAATA